MSRLANYSVFYVVWIGMIIGETYVWATFGLALGFLVFTIGGVALASFHHIQTKSGEKPLGWPLRFGKWAMSRNTWFGLLVNGALNGAPGVGLVETSLGLPWRSTFKRVMAVAVSYATVWCIINALRPHSVIPVYWYPSLSAIKQLIAFLFR